MSSILNAPRSRISSRLLTLTSQSVLFSPLLLFPSVVPVAPEGTFPVPLVRKGNDGMSYSTHHYVMAMTVASPCIAHPLAVFLSKSLGAISRLRFNSLCMMMPKRTATRDESDVVCDVDERADRKSPS